MDHTSSSSAGTVAEPHDLPDIFASVRRPDERGDHDPPAAPIVITRPADVPGAVAEAQRRRTRFVPPAETIHAFDASAPEVVE